MLNLGTAVRVTTGAWSGRTGVVRNYTQIGHPEGTLHLVEFDGPEDPAAGPHQWFHEFEVERQSSDARIG